MENVERFRTLIAQRLGLSFDNEKRSFLAELLDERVSGSGISRAGYLDELERKSLFDAEFRWLIGELTVCETYFFRNYDQFRALTEVVWPTRRLENPHRKLAILSAACASGEEAYSIAMMLREDHVEGGREASIDAVDVNAAMIEKARAARYSAWSLRETSPAMQRRWFQQEGKECCLNAEIRAAVTFEQKNLVAQDADLWQSNRYDVIFCRNVIMYFTPPHAAAVIERLTRALVSGGYLFLGHAETLRGVSSAYEICHTHDAFYYQKKPATGRVVAATNKRIAAPTSADGSVVTPAWAATWIETVQRASDRIGLLAQGIAVTDNKPEAVQSTRVHAQQGDLADVLELMREERFSDALLVLQEFPENLGHDREVLLLRASLLSHVGKLELAEQVAKQLLGIDEKHAGAHYMLGMCRESRGDRTGAIDEYRLATYLDPSFAMPRLRAGMLSRRADDREPARRELGQALVLLQSEDDARLLLFGGGFRRDALLALCRAELLASGGRT
jgi:chemotaxis protein methyltransferase CheR